MTEYSNIITPPDSISDSKNHTVLMIDVSDMYVQQVVSWCQHAQKCYDIYLYNCEMSDDKWLSEQINKAESIIMDANPSRLSDFKESLVDNQNVWVYNSVVSSESWRKIPTPLTYFIEREESVT